jgi:geranylgeranyl diphosphate synthase type I
MRAAVDTLDDNLQLPAAYHLGWCDRDGNPTTHDGGKGMRGALAVLGAEAVGGSTASGVAGAVAVELIHNFSLIHDDIMDNDRTRRHRATVWDVFGVGDAIIVGDALHVLAFEVLLGEAVDPRSMAATARLGRATSAMIAGQAQDVALDRGDDATLAECLEMEANKTGALLAQSVAIGAVLGGGDDDQVDALDRFGAALGIAFQAVDDVLGIWGDPAKTGKPVGNDLREQKKSMPIALAFERGGSLEASVRSMFAQGATDDQVERLAVELEAAGIRDEVDAIAADHLRTALAALDDVGLDAAPRTELIELAHFVTSRSG